MNLQQQAQNVAAQGRFGDSMLMHVNPAEVRGLAQAVPLTMNPETGQPEAFLPFLAPIIGSFLGSAALGGTALGTLGASSLGAGLAQWAATGDFKKGLLAGVTGYGLGSVMQGAGAAAEGAAAADAARTAAVDATAQNLAKINPELLTNTSLATDAITSAALNPAGQAQLAQQVGRMGIEKGSTLLGQEAAKSFLANDPGLGTSLQSAFQGGVGQGVKNLATGAMNPLALGATAAGMAPTAIMESQEEFARQMAQREEEERQSRLENFMMNPEPILYNAQGGTTNFDEGGSTEIDSSERFLRMLSPAYSLYKTGDYLGLADMGMLGIMPQLLGPEGALRAEGEKEDEVDKGVLMDADLIAKAMASPSDQMMAQGGRVGYRGRGRTEDSDVNTFSGDMQRFTPARQAYDVNPNFMPGFQAETMYFNPSTINQPASATRGGAAPVGVDTYTGSKGGYNVPGLAIAPTTSIDPYAPTTTAPPQGLIQTEAVPYPDQVAVPPVDTPPVTPPIDVPPIDYPPVDFPFSIPSIGGLNLGDFDLNMGAMEGFGDFEVGNMGNVNFDALQSLNAVPNPIAPVDNQFVAQDFSQIGNQFTPDLGLATEDFAMGNASLGMRPNPNLIAPPLQDNIAIQTPQMPPVEMNVPAMDMNPQDFMSIQNLNIPMGMEEMSTDLAATGMNMAPVMGMAPAMDSIAPVMDMAAPTVMPPSLDISNLPQSPGGFTGLMRPRLQNMVGRAGGGDTKKELPNKGLRALEKVAPDVVERMGFDDGGKTSVFYQPENFIENKGDIKKYSPVNPNSLSRTELMSLKRAMQTEISTGKETLAGESKNSLYYKQNKISPELINKNIKTLQGQISNIDQVISSMQKKNDGGRTSFDAGGTTNIMEDPLTREAIQFIMGESDNQQVVNDFISKYGNDMFLQLRDSVLKSLVPGAQTEGLIRGEGRSGMADDIPGMIGADEKIAVSQDEFIVPADVVSALGDGSSDAGSNALYDMMDRVRQAKTGGTTQPPMIDLNRVMPA